MNRMAFLRDKLPFLAAQTVVIALFGFILRVMQVSTAAMVLTCGAAVLTVLAELLWDWIHRTRYYAHVYDMLEQMEQKQYIASLLEPPTFADAQVLCDVLEQATKAMNDEIAGCQKAQEEYRDYIERWIHEVKVPISCIDLLCGNHPSEVTGSIAQENERIEAYIEQALYYARSTNLEKDYAIRTVSLEPLIRACVKKHARELIACRTKLQLEGLAQTVRTDPKWLDFVLGQVVSNSVKYRKGDALTLSFRAHRERECVVLEITDDGIGIPSGDLGRLTEKGFTGENGRKFAKSTGMGLYLCAELCRKMSVGFSIASRQDMGTLVSLTFPLADAFDHADSADFPQKT